MKLRCIVYLSVALFWVVRNISGQSFVNLDFEDATIVTDPSGFLYPHSVYADDAIPGWTGYLGTNEVTDLLYNDLTLGQASIDIVDTSYNGVIEGQYTVVLQWGDAPTPGPTQTVSPSISQTGLVPADAKSLQFMAYNARSFSVSLGGQDLTLLPLASGSNYTLFGADTSSFAGKIEPLTITAFGPSLTVPQYFDSFVFSSSPIPEPSVLKLLGVCILLICRHKKRFSFRFEVRQNG
jgi:hypothetical protein